MKRIALILVAGIAIALGQGCTTFTHFDKLPRPEEFKKPMAELKAAYPDLTRKETPWSLTTTVYWPEADPLKGTWGEPHDTGFTFWMLLPSNWVLNPCNYWYWQYEDKKIAALIGRPFMYGYHPHVLTLLVAERNK